MKTYITLPIIFLSALSSLLPLHAQSEAIEIPSLLQSQRSSNMAGDTRNLLRQKLDSGVLTVEKIHELCASPTIATWCYVNRCFSGGTKAYVQIEFRDREFVAWLASNPQIFKLLASSGTSNSKTFTVLYKVWQKNSKNLKPVEISMALGAGLVADSFSVDECLAKFDFYQESHRHGRCYPQADTLQPWEWALVMQGKESLEDLSWAQQYIETKKIKPEDAGGRFTGFIPYRKENYKGVSVHAGGAFYDNKPITLKLYTEYGGVCGALSKGAAGFLRSKGVPAYPIGQPGHCAFIWKHPDGSWRIGNNIGGWNWANGGTRLPWQGPVQIISTLESFLKHPGADQSDLIYTMALCSQKPQHVELLLKEACKTNPFHYPAWLKYLDIKAKNVGDKQKFEYLKELMAAMPSEHNTVEYVAKQVLKIRIDKIDSFEMYAGMIGPDNTAGAEELFTRHFWNKLCDNCPEMKGLTTYKAGLTNGFLHVFFNQSKTKKWSQKAKTRTNKAFQQALLALKVKEKVCISFAKSYRQFLILWDDNKYMMSAHNFIQDHFKKIDNEPVRKEMLNLGKKIAYLINDKKLLTLYH